MTVVLGFIGNKGGVGKSALSRTVAVALASGGLKVCIADVDPGHKNTVAWSERRKRSGILPEIEVKPYDDVESALEDAEFYDVFVVDAGAKANEKTLDIANRASLLVIPTGSGDDDLEAEAELLLALQARGVPKDRIAVVLSKGSTERKEEKTREYYRQGGYDVVEPVIRFATIYEDALSRGGSLMETGRTLFDTEAKNVVREIMERTKRAAAKDSSEQKTAKSGGLRVVGGKARA